MELLLFLSALLSGLTGFVAGDRATVPAGVERGAAQVVAVVENIAEAATVRAAAIAVPAAPAEPCEPAFFASLAPLPDPLTISERRLE